MGGLGAENPMRIVRLNDESNFLGRPGWIWLLCVLTTTVDARPLQSSSMSFKVQLVDVSITDHHATSARIATMIRDPAPRPATRHAWLIPPPARPSRARVGHALSALCRMRRARPPVRLSARVLGRRASPPWQKGVAVAV